jgi:hypothetical protein
MGEVEIKLGSGGTAVIRGTSAEIAEVLRLAGIGAASPATGSGARRRREPPESGRGPARAKRPAKIGPQARVTELVSEGFFKTKRSLTDVRNELRGRGRLYKATDLSPVMIRLVREKHLRRSKDQADHWLYLEW